MTGGVVGAVNEHRPNRRGEWIAHRQFFESVIAGKVLGGVFGELALWSGIDNAGSKQCLFDIMPAHGTRMRVRAFLRHCRRSHQLAIDAPIDLCKWVHFLVLRILRYDW